MPSDQVQEAFQQAARLAGRLGLTAPYELVAGGWSNVTLADTGGHILRVSAHDVAERRLARDTRLRLAAGPGVGARLLAYGDEPRCWQLLERGPASLADRWPTASARERDRAVAATLDALDTLHDAVRCPVMLAEPGADGGVAVRMKFHPLSVRRTLTLVDRAAGLAPPATLGRYAALVERLTREAATIEAARAAADPVAAHGDLWPGNVLYDGTTATLIDFEWWRAVPAWHEADVAVWLTYRNAPSLVADGFAACVERVRPAWFTPERAIARWATLVGHAAAHAVAKPSGANAALLLELAEERR